MISVLVLIIFVMGVTRHMICLHPNLCAQQSPMLHPSLPRPRAGGPAPCGRPPPLLPGPSAGGTTPDPSSAGGLPPGQLLAADGPPVAIIELRK